MKVLLASSEIHPYSKTGGLADMVGALGKYLGQAGVEVTLVCPLYRDAAARHPEISRTERQVSVLLGNEIVEAQLWQAQPEPGVTVLFVDQPAFFDREGLYQVKGMDYPDNAMRFIYFSKCIAHLARFGGENPDIVHVHDWQTGLVPLFIMHQRLHGGWSDAPGTCLTIHNLAFQGNFPSQAYQWTNLPWDYFDMRAVEYYGGMNCLKAGIVFADFITTVSPRYAREITTEDYGCGLDGLLRERRSDLLGILNGVDYTEWNTEENPHLQHSFGLSAMEGKGREKREVQRLFGLEVDERVPLFGTVTRLSDQKGIDILLGALEEMLSSKMQFVLLGSGHSGFERGLLDLAKRYPKQVGVQIGFDTALAHRIEAACDFYLMPSRFEPCGLNQMYSLRYGTIPIVRATGGLDDSVTDVREDVSQANGIKFHEYSGRALAKAIRKALVLFERPDLMDHYLRNGMRSDFSWNRTALAYEEVYKRILDKRRGSATRR